MNAQNTDRVLAAVGEAVRNPIPSYAIGSAPRAPTRHPEAPAVESMVAKHRELMDALGDLPQRTMVAFRDAANRTKATPQWDRVVDALYALIGDPE